MPGTRQSRSAAFALAGSPSGGTTARRLLGTGHRHPLPYPATRTRAEAPQTGRIGDGEPPVPVADPALHSSHRFVANRRCRGRRD